MSDDHHQPTSSLHTAYFVELFGEPETHHHAVSTRGCGGLVPAGNEQPRGRKSRRDDHSGSTQPGEESPQHPDQDGQHLDGAARAIADNPRLWRALLFAHTANPRGDCHSCHGVRWPCGPRALAERAEEIHDARHG